MDKQVQQIVDFALQEDIRNGDITTQAVFNNSNSSFATIIARESGVIAGLELAGYIFRKVDSDIDFSLQVKDGTAVKRGDIIAEIRGHADAILTGERTVLNFMQRMSGVATKTARFVKAVSHTNTKILDTRKTIPGHRYLDKWAVRLGGGTNHRYCLDDLYLIKENHIAVAGGIGKAIDDCLAHKESNGLQWKIEVEVTCIDELKMVLQHGGADMVLLDNMNLETMRKAVQITAGKMSIEASGNMTLDRVGTVAETGVDFISVGALTHSVNALDLSLLFE